MNGKYSVQFLIERRGWITAAICLLCIGVAAVATGQRIILHHQ
jgi:hypothetical protein